MAATFWARLRGWMWTKPPEEPEALLIMGCKQVHTFLMRYAIDVVFCDRNFRVLRVITALRPWRISPYVKDAEMCLELIAGAAEFYKIYEGEQLVDLYKHGDNM